MLADVKVENCPFCGGSVHAHPDEDHSTAWTAACGNYECAAKPSVWELSKEETVARWNARATRAPQSAPVGYVREDALQALKKPDVYAISLHKSQPLGEHVALFAEAPAPDACRDALEKIAAGHTKDDRYPNGHLYDADCPACHADKLAKDALAARPVASKCFECDGELIVVCGKCNGIGEEATPSQSERPLMTTHYLKTWPAYFDAIAKGEKNFEVRRDDRGFQRGDTVILWRFDPDGVEVLQEPALAEQLHFRIGWILTGGQFGIEPGYVVMSLRPIEQAPQTEGQE